MWFGGSSRRTAAAARAPLPRGEEEGEDAAHSAVDGQGTRWPSQQTQRPSVSGGAPPAAASTSAAPTAAEPQTGEAAAHQTQAVAVRQPVVTGPMVLTALGRVAGVAWTALKLAHRYVLIPAATWAINNLRSYLEEQLAIQRALHARPCPVTQYNDAEVRTATDGLSYTRRVLATPYGLVSYEGQLRGRDVVVVPVQLQAVADTDALWAEVDAGRALQLAPPHPHPNVAEYLGCCLAPGLAGHVYAAPAHVPDLTPSGSSTAAAGAAGAGAATWCSLRDALSSSAAAGGSARGDAGGAAAAEAARRALGSWEARVAVAQQLVAAVVHLLRRGVGVSALTGAHVVLLLPGYREQAAGQLPRVMLAPGCGFRKPLGAPQAGGAPGAAAGAAGAAAAPGGPGGGRGVAGAGAGAGGGGGGGGSGPTVSCVARGLGNTLLQVLMGAEAAARTSPSELHAALANVKAATLLCRGVSPPLTDDQAWPVLGAVYPLLVWGGGAAGAGAGSAADPGVRSSRSAGGLQQGATGGAGPGGAPHQSRSASALGGGGAGGGDQAGWGMGGWGWPAAQGPSRAGPAAARTPAGAGAGVGGGGAAGAGAAGAAAVPCVDDAALELAGYLLRDVAPALLALTQALQLHGRGSSGAAGGRGGRGGVASPQAHGTASYSAGGPLGGTPGVGRGPPPAATPSPGAYPLIPGMEGDGFPGGHPHPGGPSPREDDDPFRDASAPPMAFGDLPTAPSAPSAPLPYPAPFPAPGPAAAPPASRSARGAVQPPAEFVCPITQDLMHDPVVCADGHSYERSAIAAWLAAGHSTSPLTGAQLPSTALTPNFTLRSLIRDWRERHGGEL